MTPEKLSRLRSVVTESTRVQRGGADPIPYIDTGNSLADACGRQNHTIFARRGCGKTLLLHTSQKKLESGYKAIYLNCEDFKRHSYPNVLIEILDKLFDRLGTIPGLIAVNDWRARILIRGIKRNLKQFRVKSDKEDAEVRESRTNEDKNG
jgi:Cdc6-like AAA superfamily ATPase